MNQDPISDAGTTALLAAMQLKEPSINMDLDGEDADGIRGVHLLCRKVPVVSTSVAPDSIAPAPGSTAEEAANASKAVSLFARLEGTQGLRVALDNQLEYSLMTQLDNLQHKNNCMNKRIGLGNMVAQPKKKVTERSLGLGLKVSFDDVHEDEKYKYNEVTLMLRTFFYGLAAILSYEVTPNLDRDGEVPVLSEEGTGLKMCVAGTLSSCLDLMFEIVKATGLYSLKYADSIFRSAFSKTMELASTRHFDKAVALVVEYHPSAFRPSEEELKEYENATRQNTPKSTQPGKGGSKAKAPRSPAAAPQAQAAKKQKMDPSAAPCHGIVYSGSCSKGATCPWDHDAGRCSAMKAAHPDGPPSRAAGP